MGAYEDAFRAKPKGKKGKKGKKGASPRKKQTHNLDAKLEHHNEEEAKNLHVSEAGEISDGASIPEEKKEGEEDMAEEIKAGEIQGADNSKKLEEKGTVVGENKADGDNEDATGAERTETVGTIKDSEYEFKRENSYLFRSTERQMTLSEHEGKRVNLARQTTETGNLLGYKGQDDIFDKDIAGHGDNYDRMMKDIENQRDELLNPKWDEYIQNFNREAQDEQVMLGAIDVEVLREEEQKLEEERIRRAQLESLHYQRQELKIMRRQEVARQRLLYHNERVDEKMQADQRQATLRQRQRDMLLSREYQKSEAKLVSKLAKKDCELKIDFNDVDIEGNEFMFGGARNRQYRLEWNYTPQPVEVRINLARALKDKVASGRYVVVTSVWDRLSGTILEYSGVQENKRKLWRRLTLPQTHEAKFSNNELKFDASLFFLAPSKVEVRPSMLFMFELVLLSNTRTSPVDQVVGWGVFPLINSEFKINEGEFMTPLLKGPIDPTYDKYKDIEKAYRDNIDNWLCNLYFSTEVHDYHILHQKEFRVDLLLYEFDPLAEVEVDLLEEEAERDVEANLGGIQYVKKPRDLNSSISSHASLGSNSRQVMSPSGLTSSLRRFEDGSPSDIGGDMENNEFIPCLRDDAEHLEDRKLEGEDVFVKVHGNFAQKESEDLETRDDYRKHGFLVMKPEGISKDDALTRIRYLLDELVFDLGLQRKRSWSFFKTIILLLLVIYVQLFSHYLGQWIFLKIDNIPITKIETGAAWIQLEFSPLEFEDYIIALAGGPCLNEVIFLILIQFTIFFQKAVGNIPNTISKFISLFGFMAIFEYIPVMIVDCLRANWDGDFFKLYNYFQNSEGTGILGIFLTVFMYVGMSIIFAFILYNYLLFLHMNGRLLDIYYRLSNNSDRFFLPQDMEVSTAYVTHVCEKAKIHKGPNGEERKIVVSEYNLTDPFDPYFHQKSTHICIFEVDLRKRRTLYRQFVRLPEGSILELDNNYDYSIPEYDWLQDRLKDTSLSSVHSSRMATPLAKRSRSKMEFEESKEESSLLKNGTSEKEQDKLLEDDSDEGEIHESEMQEGGGDDSFKAVADEFREKTIVKEGISRAGTKKGDYDALAGESEMTTLKKNE